VKIIIAIISKKLQKQKLKKLQLLVTTYYHCTKDTF